jgi:hypothetical protein
MTAVCKLPPTNELTLNPIDLRRNVCVVVNTFP